MESDSSVGGGASERLGWGWFVLSAAVALVLRTCNLGTFSLWLDEVLIVQRSLGGVVATWRRCLANAEHPPLSALVLAAGNRLGLSDAAQALVPVAVGVATVVLLAVWTTRHFGRRAGQTVAILAAVSPVHIRYSQELRPYAYLLGFAVLTLVLLDRLLDRPGWRTASGLAVAVVGGLYSHIQYPLVVVPAAIMVLARLRARPEVVRRAAAGLGGALAVALLLYAPWLVASTATMASRPPAGGAANWSWHLVGERWEFLTVAARYGDDFSVAGAVVLVVALVGVVSAWRRSAGAASLAAVGVATVGIEAALLAAGHWTHGRYSLMAWPFLMVLIAVGVSRLHALRAPVGWLTCAVLAAVSLQSVGEYQRIGRPSWDRLAEVVTMLYGDGDVLLTENVTCRIGLGYALQHVSEEAIPLQSIDGDLEKLRQLWPAGRSCLIVVGRLPAAEALRHRLQRFPEVVEYYSTARLYRLTPDDRTALLDEAVGPPQDPRDGWPSPRLWLLPDDLQGDQGTCWQRAMDLLVRSPVPEPTTHLDFEPGPTGAALLAGWSGFERTADGTSFVWAQGRESGIVLRWPEPADLLITLRLWPFAVPGRSQRLRALVGGEEVGVVDLARGAQEIELSVPASRLRAGQNLLVLQSAYAVAPAEVRPGSTDRRRLAFAVDWLHAQPQGP